jgi:hypothetical protein
MPKCQPITSHCFNFSKAEMFSTFSLGGNTLDYFDTIVIEIGLERAPFVVLVNFFPHLNMQKVC